MNKPSPDNTFVFSYPIDTQYILELYAGDYVMIRETFTDVLADYDEFVQNIISSYGTGDVEALRTAVHKIKPLFGYVGLLSLQAACQDFEDACPRAGLPALAADFKLLESKLIQVKSFIETEKERLERYFES